MGTNINFFTISGVVTRINPIGDNGAILTIVNNQDYKKDDEWVKVAHFISVAFFQGIKNKDGSMKVAVGNFVSVTGKLSVRANPNLKDEMKSVLSLIGDKIEVSSLSGNKEETKSESKPKPPAQKPKSNWSQREQNNSTDDEEDEPLF